MASSSVDSSNSSSWSSGSNSDSSAASSTASSSAGSSSSDASSSLSNSSSISDSIPNLYANPYSSGSSDSSSELFDRLDAAQPGTGDGFPARERPRPASPSKSMDADTSSSNSTQAEPRAKNVGDIPVKPNATTTTSDAGEAEATCRICWDSDGSLIAPCQCSGTQKWVHIDCIFTWEATQEQTNPNFVKGVCPTCKNHYDHGLVPLAVTAHLQRKLARPEWRIIRIVCGIILTMGLLLGSVVPSILMGYPEESYYTNGRGERTDVYRLLEISCVIGWVSQCLTLLVVLMYSRTRSFVMLSAWKHYSLFTLASFYLPLYLFLFFAAILLSDLDHSQWTLYASVMGLGAVAYAMTGILHLIIHTTTLCGRRMYFAMRRRRGAAPGGGDAAQHA